MGIFFRGGAAVLLVGLLTTPVAAVVTDFTWLPADPVMGETVAYTAVTDGQAPFPATYKWEYKFTSGSCQGTWIDSMQTSQTASFVEHRPGTWDIRLTVTYNPPPFPVHAPTVIIKSVTIAPATHFTIIGGFNTNTLIGTSIIAKFRVEAATRPCGSYICANVAQERLTNRWCLSPPYPQQNLADSDWVPDTADPAFQFQPGTNEIWDTKTQNTGVWSALPVDVNNEYRRDVQWLRIKYIDPCGDTQTLDIGSFTIRRFKVDDYNWKITP